MTGLDFILLLLLASYVWIGFSTGLIHSLGSLVGVIVGALAASHWFADWTPRLSGLVGGELPAAVVAFVAIFLIVSRGTGLLFALVNRLFNLLAVIPGIKLLNRLGGGVFGLLEGIFGIGLTLNFLARLPINEGVAHALDRSLLVPVFVGLSGWLVALLPAVMRNAKSVLQRS